MSTLEEYVRWMADFPIETTGFLDADAMVLCALSYIDFSPLLSGEIPLERISSTAILSSRPAIP